VAAAKNKQRLTTARRSPSKAVTSIRQPPPRRQGRRRRDGTDLAAAALLVSPGGISYQTAGQRSKKSTTGGIVPRVPEREQREKTPRSRKELRASPRFSGIGASDRVDSDALHKLRDRRDASRLSRKLFSNAAVLSSVAQTKTTGAAKE